MFTKATPFSTLSRELLFLHSRGSDKVEWSIEGHDPTCLGKFEGSCESHAHTRVGRVKRSLEGHAHARVPFIGVSGMDEGLRPYRPSFCIILLIFLNRRKLI